MGLNKYRPTNFAKDTGFLPIIKTCKKNKIVPTPTMFRTHISMWVVCQCAWFVSWTPE